MDSVPLTTIQNKTTLVHNAHKKTIVTGHAMVCSGLKSAEIKYPKQYRLFPEKLGSSRRPKRLETAGAICTATGKFESGNDTHATMLEDGQENQ